MAIVRDGNAATFRAAVYSQPHRATIEFLQRRFEDPSRALNLADSNFRLRAQAAFERNFSEEALEERARIRRSLDRVWDEDRIKPLTTLADIQTARPTMQRWIMANPNLRRLYKRRAISGYGESYIDNSPNCFDASHYDFQIATNGLAVECEENGWVATTYMNELFESDSHLSFAEQLAIRDTWEATDILIASQEIDPTSPSGDPWG